MFPSRLELLLRPRTKGTSPYSVLATRVIPSLTSSSSPREGGVCGTWGSLRDQLGDVRLERERREVDLGEDEVWRLGSQHDVVTSSKGTTARSHASIVSCFTVLFLGFFPTLFFLFFLVYKQPLPLPLFQSRRNSTSHRVISRTKENARERRRRRAHGSSGAHRHTVATTTHKQT